MKLNLLTAAVLTSGVAMFASTANAGSTANTYSYGYCTYFVASRRSVPSMWGNASAWYYNAQASGYAVGSTPQVGAIAWTAAGYYGHVAYVEAVNGIDAVEDEAYDPEAAKAAIEAVKNQGKK